LTNFTDARFAPVMTRVWDPLVRIFHWSLVASFAVAWFSSESRGYLHEWAGYAAASLILMRLLWGFIGTPYARFSQFVSSPKTVIAYLHAIITGSETRYLGHNPAGGMMVLALMAGISGTAFTGWMMTTETYYGDDTVQIIHSLFADGMIVLLVGHLGGVALASFRHKENLVKSMVMGEKRECENGDVA
jgi:cytochrome b